MAVEQIEQVVDIVAQQVVQAMGALTPVGVALSGTITVLSIVMLGVSITQGGTFLPQITRITAASAGTLWAIREWPDITMGMLKAARAAVGLMIGGYSGPTTLFQMAIDVAGRLEVEKVSWEWGAGITGNIAAGLMSAFIPPLVFVGLSLTGILAILAEFQLLLGAAVAPLILPALCFPVTASMGWGAVYFLESASLKVIFLGLASFVMANAVTSVIGVGGTEATLTHDQVYTLLGIAVLTTLMGLACNSLATMVAGAPGGGMGLATVLHAGSIVGGAMTMGASTAAGAAGKAVAAGGGAVGQAVGAVNRGMGNAAKVARSSGVGAGGFGP